MSRPSTFLFVTPSYIPFPGGAQNFQHAIARRLVADGQRVVVLTSNARQPSDFWRRPASKNPPLPQREVIDGVTVERLSLAHPPPRPMAFGLLRRAGHWMQRSRLPARVQVPLLRWLAGWMPPLSGLRDALDRLAAEADLIQAVDSSWDGLFVAGTEAARRHQKPLVAVPLMHLGDARVQAHFRMAHQVRAYHAADILLALSKAEATAYAGMGVAPDRIAVIPMGVDPALNAGSDDPDGAAFRQRHGLTGPIVAFLGPNTYDKGAFTLAEAVAELNRSGQAVHLVCAGAQGEELAGFLRRRPSVIQAACRGRIHLLGMVEDSIKHQLLGACDLLALPSQVDTFGIVLLEAWLHGKPVIGARAGGIPEVIDEGRTGLLVPFGDAAALAQSIAWMLDHPEEAAEMGRRGREVTLQRWTWDAVYARVRSVYERCLTR